MQEPVRKRRNPESRPHHARRSRETPPAEAPKRTVHSSSVCVPAVRGLLFGVLLAGTIVFYVYNGLGGMRQAYLRGHYIRRVGSDSALNGSVSVADAAELGDVNLSQPRNGILLTSPSPVGLGMSIKYHFEVALAANPHRKNPWAGAGRRARGDLVVTEPGCGGTYLSAIAFQDQVRLRYVGRQGGVVIDSTRGRPPVDLVVGTMQVGAELDKALVGVCAGEVLRVSAPGDVSLLVAVLAVRKALTGIWRGRAGEVGYGDSAEAEDRLARGVFATTGRRGASCDAICRSNSMLCVDAAFAVVNSCPRLRTAFSCVQCEVAAVGTAGPDMPCHVSTNAPLGHPRGFCMVHPSVKDATCGARYKHTRRLCPCFKNLPL